MIPGSLQKKLLYELLQGGQSAQQTHTLKGYLYPLIDMAAFIVLERLEKKGTARFSSCCKGVRVAQVKKID